VDDLLLKHIDSQRDGDVELLRRWSAINSGTYNVAGLRRMEDELRAAFAPLGASEELIDLPPAESIDSSGNIVRLPLGRAIRLIKRPDAPRRVLLCIHYDTVFPADHPFRTPRMSDPGTMIGPGVNDAKGGIVVMLAALRALESVGTHLGWEVLLNPDEEIGSPGSAALLREAASRNICGLLFEPALPDGSLVGARKGSGNFVAVVRGRAAHAGRDFDSGRSAIVALADLIARLDAVGRQIGDGVTVNCGRIEGGGAVNVVPDLAIGRFNVRATDPRESDQLEAAIRRQVEEVSHRDGITVTLHGGIHSQPKLLDERSQRLIHTAVACGRELELDLAVKSSGGTCDGNKLASAGLPVLDTLGPVGGEIHSDREFVHIDSIAQRAKLTALLLSRLTDGV
jgi:glutamate carboxypeptidase